MRRLLTLLTCAGTLFITASAASAQSIDPYAATFSANYDLVYHELGDTSNLGAHFDVASTVTRAAPYLVLVGEVGVNHFSDANVSSFLGGARLRLPNAAPRVLPFAQFLLGLYHCGACDINDFAIQGGAGLDVKLARSNDVRIRGQVDVRHMFDAVEDFNAVRLSIGIVVPLNR
jgi:hypothetical protein